MPTLRSDKLKALKELIGEDAAGALLSSLKERDTAANNLNVGFKSADGLSDEQQTALMDAVMGAISEDVATEKCTPGTKDGKYMATKEDGEEDMSEEADGEEDMSEEEPDGDEMLLSGADVKAIATAVAKALAASMSEMKAIMRQKSSQPDSIESLKEYTAAQNEFAETLVSTMEELLTRVKAVEEATNAGHVPSQSSANALKNMQSVYGATPEQHVADWLFNNR
jgi:hypothetical protein